jgi:ABC-2 type transport system permease protein
LIIPALSTIFHAVIASGIMVATARPLFGAALPTDWAAFVLVSLLTIAAFAALGALIGVASANARATVLWSQLVFLPSMLIGGLMLPLNLIPKAMLPFSALLPPARAMQALVGLAYRQETVLNPIVSAGVLLATALLGFGLAIYLFDWDRVNRARRGHPLLVLVPYIVGIFLD